MNKQILALWGLKWNPFAADVPVEALLATPAMENFFWRIEQSHVREGGFALIAGEVGAGKSTAMRLLHERLRGAADLVVAELAHAQCSLADFYRELGDLFGVNLSPRNRWGGFKSLRDVWRTHIDATLYRPLLLIDEAQEMQPQVLSELRLLSSTRFDSRIILSVILSGDHRLALRLQEAELAPLASRLRFRLRLEAPTPQDLLVCLKHRLSAAGAASVMTEGLMHTLCDHALGDYRTLLNLAGELLLEAGRRECLRLDEQLFLEVFQPPHPPVPPRGKKR